MLLRSSFLILGSAGLVLGQAPTTTTLDVSPRMSTAGQSVTLSATVVPPVPSGRVTFYDGTAILGVSPVLGGVATLKTRFLPSGMRSLRALFWGDRAAARSESSGVRHSVAPVGSSFLFPQPESLSLALGENIQDLASGDFDGDGRLDLAIVTDRAVGVHLGNGNGGFRQASQSPLPAAIVSARVTAADFDGDSNLDAAIVYLSFGTSSRFSTSVHVKFGDGSGRLDRSVDVTARVADPPESYTALRVLMSISVADLNGDGAPDLVAGRGCALALLTNTGSGQFAAEEAVSFPSESKDPCPLRSEVEAADLDGDGTIDLAALVGQPQEIQIVFRPKDRSSPGAVRRLPFEGAYRLQAGDFNGDLSPDLAVTSWSAEKGYRVSLLLNRPSGEFDAQPELTVPRPDDFLLDDFDGDGNLDIVVGSSNILRGDGRGGLSNHTPGPLDASNPAGFLVVAADLNGDGRRDWIRLFSGGSFQLWLASSGPAIFEITDAKIANSWRVGSTVTLQFQVREFEALGAPEGVSVVFSLPVGVEVVSLSGIGWRCVESTASCSRSEMRRQAADYPPINVSLRATGSACRGVVNPPFLQMLRLETYRASVFLGSTQTAALRGASVDVSGCLLVSHKPPQEVVVSETVYDYSIVVEAAPNVSLPNLEVEAIITLAGLKVHGERLDVPGWSCSVTTASVYCRTYYSDALLPIRLPVVPLQSGCPLSISQVTLSYAGVLQSQAQSTLELRGCLFVTPSSYDFGRVRHGERVFTTIEIVSRDLAELDFSYEILGPRLGPWGIFWQDIPRPVAPFGNYCPTSRLSYGRSCAFAAVFDACEEVKAVLKIETSKKSEYLVPLKGKGVPARVEYVIAGVRQGEVPVNGNLIVDTNVFPAGRDAYSYSCPKNITFDWSFTPANGQSGKFEASFDGSTLKTGTVAGEIVLEAYPRSEDERAEDLRNRKTGEERPPAGRILKLTVPKQRAVVDSVALEPPTASSFNVVVAGYSTPREIGPEAKTEVCLTFLSASGATVQNGTPQCVMKDDIRIWYERPESYKDGSRFKGRATVSFAGDRAAIGVIKVIIKNSVGDSAPYCIDAKSGAKRDCP